MKITRTQERYMFIFIGQLSIIGTIIIVTALVQHIT